MNLRVFSNIALAVAILVAAIAALVVYNKHEAIARAEVVKAEVEESAAKEAARKARSEEAAAAAKAEAARADAARASDEKAAKDAEAAAARDAEKRTANEKQITANKRAIAEAEAKKAAEERETERAKAEAKRAEEEKAKQLAAAEAAKEASAAAALEKEKLASERIIAEAKLQELHKLDLVTLERELLDYKKELDERERALRPDKTIDNLAWVSKDDMILDANNNLVKQEKQPYLAENDKTLPKETRALAKVQRELAEADAAERAESRTVVISKLEKLYLDALKEDRILDSDFYKKTIKSLYPDWEPSAAGSRTSQTADDMGGAASSRASTNKESTTK